MYSKIYSAVNIGLDSKLVEVETDLKDGFPRFDILGLGDKAIEEAKGRVRSAIINSNFSFPARKKIIVNLAPADIKKEGTSYDLPLAVGILLSSEQIDPVLIKEKTLFVGELSLEGKLRHTKGILPMAILAKKLGIKNIFLPETNRVEASLVNGLNIYPLESLKDFLLHLSGEKIIKPFHPLELEKEPEYQNDFEDIKGQETAKRALKIVAAGGHNLLMIGPPGSGKTLLAQAIPSILPPMAKEEILEVSKIYSIAGLLNEKEYLKKTRPFRSPHHTISDIAMVGGSANPRPGEISLAHRGVLFLDEFSEFSRSALESLRQPLENGYITISRAKNSINYPAEFILVAAQNPCPCGWYGDREKQCICSSGKIIQYRKKISGPLLDRIDLHLEVPRLKFKEISTKKKQESSAEIRKKVERARKIQKERFKKEKRKIFTNAEMSPKDLEKFCPINQEGEKLLKAAIDQFALSGRAYHRILKVARTIADLEEQEKITSKHLAEAISYRVKLEEGLI